jgi:hypothetical protein
MPSAFSWPVSVPSALRAPAPVNLGVRPQQKITSMLPYIIGTMLAAGIVGGLINSYLADSMVEKPLVWWKHIIVGIGAAFMVPVFLNMISSRLISEISGTEITSEVLSKLLV